MVEKYNPFRHSGIGKREKKDSKKSKEGYTTKKNYKGWSR